MEPWQRLGVYAAGLALDAAGVKDDAAFKARMHLIVAAGGGERDYAVDGAILTGLRDAADPGAFLNERLMSDLRPTLFLAQLSNLLAGNISIVHGVTGASRTFMGEEQAGVDAAADRPGAHRRRARSTSMLVGGSYNAERPDVLVIHEHGRLLCERPDSAPVFARAARAAASSSAAGRPSWCWRRASMRAARGATASAALGRRGRRPDPARSRAAWRRALERPLARGSALGIRSAVISGATGVDADHATRSGRASRGLAPGAHRPRPSAIWSGTRLEVAGAVRRRARRPALSPPRRAREVVVTTSATGAAKAWCGSRSRGRGGQHGA